MSNAPKVYSPQDLLILRQTKNGSGPEFSVEDMQALQTGQASFKLQNKADKALEKYRGRMRASVSRQEALDIFITRKELFMMDMKTLPPQVAQFIGRINDELVILREVLLGKGMVTEQERALKRHELEIAAAQEPCVYCECGEKKQEAFCDAYAYVAFDAMPELGIDHPLAPKVLRCDCFEPKKQEVK